MLSLNANENASDVSVLVTLSPEPTQQMSSGRNSTEKVGILSMR